MGNNKKIYDYLKSLIPADITPTEGTQFTPSSAPGIIAGTPSGASIPLNKLSSKSKGFVQSTNQLTLVREWTNDKRTAGTMWYGGKILGFTVEDAIRTTKLAGKTAIPKGNFNLALDKTGVPSLERNYVKFPGDNRTAFRTGVFPRIGSSKDAVTLEGYGLSFAGIRIHNGTNEGWSEGCVIYSSIRNNDGTLKDDLNHCKALTKFIYDNNITKITITNEWENNPPINQTQTLTPTPIPLIDNLANPQGFNYKPPLFNPFFLPK
jgi:hypothetical protein